MTLTRATFPRAGNHPKHLSSRRLPVTRPCPPRLSSHLAGRRSRRGRGGRRRQR